MLYPVRQRPPTKKRNTDADCTQYHAISFFVLSCCLIAAGVLWNRWRRVNGLNIFGHTDQPGIKGSEFGTKPTIAILPLVGQGDDFNVSVFRGRVD